MREIVLARHGRLAWDFRTPIAGSEFARWCAAEDQAPLAAGQAPGARLAELVRTAACLLASPLRRSRESVALLAPGREPLIDPCFREAALPAIQSRIRLRPDLWEMLARSVWLCGWSAGVEDVAAARRRAAQAAATLVAQAERFGRVVLVGHGMMNTLIARQLRARGWRGPRFPSRRHWAFGTYQHREG